jgi:hypothetical protein
MKKVIARATLKTTGRDRAYWLSRPVEERFAAVEHLRQQWLALNPDAGSKLQRVCRITRLHLD